MKEPLRCTDGCGAKVADESEAQAKAWRYLEITKRYRCPRCRLELDKVNQSYKEQDGKRAD